MFAYIVYNLIHMFLQAKWSFKDLTFNKTQMASVECQVLTTVLYTLESGLDLKNRYVYRLRRIVRARSSIPPPPP